MRQWITTEDSTTNPLTKGARTYEEMLSGLSDRCKERIEGFEEIFADVVTHRVESENAVNMPVSSDGSKLTHQ